MKTMLFLFISSVSLHLFAAEDVNVDCSQAKDRKVTLTVTDERLTNEQALERAFKCFMSRNGNKIARDAKAFAIRALRKESTSPLQCPISTNNLQIVELKSWNGTRPYPTDESGMFSVGRQGTYLVRQPFSCSGVGSGLYEGVVSSVSLIIEIQETYAFELEKDDGKAKQKISIELKNAIQL